MSRLPAELLMKFWTEETPSGSINGSNTSFTIANTPLEGEAVFVFLNGLYQTPTTDYSISGTTITFVTAPVTNQILKVNYIRKTGE